MDQEIEEIYRQVEEQASAEEFEALVEEKVALMAGLCDRRTAAMLVARELGASEVLTKIGSIRPEMGNVAFTGRVLSVSEVREFQRSDGSIGRVASLTVGDETGKVRVVLWDERAELVRSGELRVDQCLKVRGTAKEGYAGTEVSIGRGGGLEEVDLEIRPKTEPYRISEIRRDMGEIDLVAAVVDPGQPREFVRKDGSQGLVRSVLLGDETGKIRLTLWNEHASMPLTRGETLEIINASTRERYGSLEVQTGSRSIVRKSSRQVSFSERITRISDLREGMICSVRGFVTGIGEVREFQRDDGTPGRVASLYISDETGRIRVSLWGDHVRHLEGLDIGSFAEILDARVKSGWNEELEISCGWGARITFAPPGEGS
ncbi:MAG: OB-fold nucleic acid binding domain-containing protein [Methanothrix sp.]|nr:OB-fold nucleic acid binding domain-containing protein [Methanothrix sp.]